MLKYVLLALSLISFGAQAAEEPILEIANRSAQDISVKIDRFPKGNEGNVKTSHFTIPGNATKAAHDVQKGDGLKLEVSFLRDGGKQVQRVYFKNSANEKTKYLSWNPDRDPKTPLYPQTGTALSRVGSLFGGTTKTQTGLSLRNNVTREEIEQTRAE